MGIQFNDLSVMVHVKTHIGSTYFHGAKGKLLEKDIWNSVETAYPAQVCSIKKKTYTTLKFE